jgi:FkbM family methyltransferase
MGGLLRNLRVGLKRWPVWNDLYVRRIKRGILRPRDPLYAILDRLSRHHGGRVRFVQLGASDGLRNDPLREFVVRDAWTGALVEPLPSAFAELKKNYAHLRRPGLAFVNAAVSDRPGTMPFYVPGDPFLERLSVEKRMLFLRKASFTRSHLEAFFLKKGEDPAQIRRVDVPCVTLETLLAEPVDLLAMDVEGHEPVILRSIDFGRHSIGAILFESLHLGPEKARIFAMLEEKGYRIREMKADAVAVRPELEFLLDP